MVSSNRGKVRWTLLVLTFIINDDDESRLLKCASHPDITTFKTPKGGIINVALKDPASLSVITNTGYLCSTEHNTWIVSTLSGQTTYYSSSNIRQICIRPFAHGWHQFTAVLAKTYGQQALFFPSFKGGLTFGTSQFEPNGTSIPKKRTKHLVAPIEIATLRADQESE